MTDIDKLAQQAVQPDLLALAARVEALKRDTSETTNALMRRLRIAEGIIATVAVNCRKTSDPAALVAELASVDFSQWLKTGCYPEPKAAQQQEADCG